MTFQPKHVPFREALRIVSDRVGIKAGQLNPLWMALAERAIDVDVLLEGKWTRCSDASKLDIWFPNSISGGHQEPGNGQTSHEYVQVAAADIDKLFPSQQSSANSKKGGRPVKYDWEAILIEMARINHYEGLPPQQATMVKRIQEWYTTGHSQEPDLSELKKRVSKFYQVIKSET